MLNLFIARGIYASPVTFLFRNFPGKSILNSYPAQLVPENNFYKMTSLEINFMF